MATINKIQTNGTTYDIAVSGSNVSGAVASAGTLTGLTATVTELNYCDGVTSNIQTQIDNLGKSVADGKELLAETISNTFGRSPASDSPFAKFCEVIEFGARDLSALRYNEGYDDGQYYGYNQGYADGAKDGTETYNLIPMYWMDDVDAGVAYYFAECRVPIVKDYVQVFLPILVEVAGQHHYLLAEGICPLGATVSLEVRTGSEVICDGCQISYSDYLDQPMIYLYIPLDYTQVTNYFGQGGGHLYDNRGMLIFSNERANLSTSY